MKKSIICLFLMSLLVLAAESNATTIYDNGLPNGQGNYGELTGFKQFDSFTLASTQNVTGVTFWAWCLYPITSSYYGYKGSIFWEIYSDTGYGSPDNLLAHGSAAPTPTPTSYTNSIYSAPDYRFDFSIGDNILGAGTYWLGLHNGDPSIYYTDASFYWETTNPNLTYSTLSYDIKYSYWFGNFDQENAFQLSGEQVPLPSTALLLSSGLLGLGFLRRKWSLMK